MPSVAQSVLWLLSLALERKSPGCRPGPTILTLKDLDLKGLAPKDFDLKTSNLEQGTKNAKSQKSKVRRVR